MAEFFLKCGTRVLVDDEDFAHVMRWKWRLYRGGYVGRSTNNRGEGQRCVLLHRFVMNAPSDKEVHHRHGIKTDNRKSELQLIDPTEHKRHHANHLVQYQKARRTYPDQKRCANCGREFMVNPRKRKRNKCCSTGCASAMRKEGWRKSENKGGALSRKHGNQSRKPSLKPSPKTFDPIYSLNL